QLTTPEHPVSKRKVGQGRSPLLHCISPSIISPSATPSQKYSSRTNAGVVVASYGQPHSTQWQGCQGRTAQVERFTGGHDALLKPYKHMFQGLHDIREVLDQKIEDMGHFLKEAYNIEEFSSLTLPTQESVTVLGQICCDGNGKLNHQSLLLEGNVDISAGLTVPLNISDVNEYSLFPGQVVVMDGINTSGQTFVASKLYESNNVFLWRAEAAMVLVGCGPYTTSDGICYDPLLDLIAVIKRDRPDVCLLVCSCSLLFLKWLVFVPSLRDSFHNFVYPLPPYTDLGIPAQDTQRVHFVAEPSTIIINGVVFGLSSTDVFFHMSSEEIATPDRFTRLLKHILTQHSYFPLYPPPEEVPVNYEHLQQFATFSVTPDILILPSKLRHFMKEVLGCFCINPGRLTKGHVGGNFARLIVQRPPAPVTGENLPLPCISGEIVRI
uniref:DNA polymerase alpha subunit B n=1 Tax=Eptatretus burgeri TaxID=7764 RepID=A0A8C4R083_EPTBU